MLVNSYNVKLFLSIILTGFVIKIMDDYLDGDNSRTRDLIKKMDKGILPYSLILFSIACMLNCKIPISFLVSAYIVGMFGEMNRILSFKLKAYHESLFLLLISIYFLGFYQMLSSFLIILMIQLIDDIIDVKKDNYYGLKNYVTKFGIVEVSLFTIILFLIVIKIDLLKLVYVMVVFLTIQYFEHYKER